MNFFQKYPKHKLLLVAIDFLLIHISFLLAIKVRFLGSMNVGYFQNMDIASKWLNFLPYSIVMIFYFQYANFYKFQNIVHTKVRFNLILKSIVVGVCGYIIYQFVVKDTVAIDSRLYYIYFTCILCILFIPVRIYFVEIIRKIPYLMDNIIIIGTGKGGTELANTFSKKKNLYNVVGFIDDHRDAKPVNSIPVLGQIKDAVQISEKFKIQSFILGFDNISRKRFFEIFEYFINKGLVLTVNSEYLNILHKKHDGLDEYEELKLVRFSENDKHSFLVYIKRLYDIIFSLIGIFLLSPCLIIIAILVKFSSPGPIIYSQVRVGKNGKQFKFYKFRSMKLGSDKDKNREQKIQDFIKGGQSGSAGSNKVVNKGNITPIGAILRKHSLDELPQLFNVIKGDMSLVGARPCIVAEWEQYEDWQKLRLSTTPGCTGIWQVYGRSEVNFEESVLLDIYYNQNFTPWWDTKLILQTLPVLIFGSGGE